MSRVTRGAGGYKEVEERSRSRSNQTAKDDFIGKGE